jgi:hypothetical protein
MRAAQRATTLAMDQLVQKGVGPVTAGLMELAVGIEKVITGIPGLDKKTSVSNPGEGRGKNAPATAGYGTDTNPADFVNFVNETAAKGFGALKGAAKPREVTTGTQAHQAFSGNAARLADTSRTPVGNTSGVQAHNILQQQADRAAGSNSNPGSTTGTGTGSTSAANPDLSRDMMSMVANIGMQTSSTQELVELMRRSIAIQDKLLQQTRN